MDDGALLRQQNGDSFSQNFRWLRVNALDPLYSLYLLVTVSHANKNSAR